MKLIDSALTEDQVTGEAVQIRFVPLSVIKKLDRVLWSKNAKRHDLPGIFKSIEKYGFIDPPKWDKNLNDGKGGLVFGNGRTKSTVEALIEAQKQKLDPPRGIPIAKESGEWCIPIKFGVDAESEAAAIAAAIDHNNLTLSGSEFDIHEVAKIWDESYLDVLSAIADQDVFPVTVDQADLNALIEASKTPDFEPSSLDEQSALDQAAPKKEIDCTCPKCGHEFSQQV